ncbi:hypothetical protein RM545_00610 [Zunongwangia sp. F260]|uniref:Uncharacterized protein n=1 Tax=Autumnicola lenta TaxID=3075593 RepID=A0ABU3CGQ6_9FLAO|nr:hypothetical protein [Zunongwangia sp. F260]MDT0645175.1 hypothetical protein [Zunongwangia sp. F260]
MLEHKEDIQVLFLGSSETQRAINPRYLNFESINLANSSQRFYEDFKLLKAFTDKLPNLEMVVIEVSYDRAHRSKNHTSKVIDHKNLAFYSINTFQRDVKFQDNFLFFSNQGYFSKRLQDHIFDESGIQLNEYGFDENKYYGSYQAVGHKDSLIKNEDIFIENIEDTLSFKKNFELLEHMIQFSLKRGLQVLLYVPPAHYRYQKLRNPEIVDSRDRLISRLKRSYPHIKIYRQDSLNFEARYFYNANHLNPDGAEIATKEFNKYLYKNFSSP